MPWPACVPDLADSVVRLRAHRPDDAARIVEQCNDAESIRWTTPPQPYGADQAREFLDLIEAGWNDADGSRYFAICDADDPEGRYQGTIDLRQRGAGIAYVGFGLHPQGRGRHLMAGALRLICRWWFAQGGERVFWEANRGNFASWRVAWACGFTHHGTTPQLLAHRGEAVDGWRASLGRADDPTRPVAPWRDPVALEGDGVRLRSWRAADVASLEPGTSPEHFMPPGAEPTADTFDEWWLTRRERMALGRSTHWCMAEVDGDAARGDLVLIEQWQEEGTVELGYFLFGSARGRGVATRAARLALAYAFAPAPDGLGMRRAVALTVGDNDPSAAVLERLGFTQWGREPAFCARSDGTFDEARHWILIPPQA